MAALFRFSPESPQPISFPSLSVLPFRRNQGDQNHDSIHHNSHRPRVGTASTTGRQRNDRGDNHRTGSVGRKGVAECRTRSCSSPSSCPACRARGNHRSQPSRLCALPPRARDRIAREVYPSLLHQSRMGRDCPRREYGIAFDCEFGAKRDVGSSCQLNFLQPLDSPSVFAHSLTDAAALFRSAVAYASFPSTSLGDQRIIQ